MGELNRVWFFYVIYAIGLLQLKLLTKHNKFIIDFLECSNKLYFCLIFKNRLIKIEIFIGVDLYDCQSTKNSNLTNAKITNNLSVFFYE